MGAGILKYWHAGQDIGPALLPFKGPVILKYPQYKTNTYLRADFAHYYGFLQRWNRFIYGYVYIGLSRRDIQTRTRATFFSLQKL